MPGPAGPPQAGLESSPGFRARFIPIHPDCQENSTLPSGPSTGAPEAFFQRFFCMQRVSSVSSNQTSRTMSMVKKKHSSGRKPATLFLWSDSRTTLPRRLEAIAGREDGSIVYSPKPLGCSISALEAGAASARVPREAP